MKVRGLTGKGNPLKDSKLEGGGEKEYAKIPWWVNNLGVKERATKGREKTRGNCKRVGW